MVPDLRCVGLLAFLFDNNVLTLSHREAPGKELGTFLVDALDAQILEVLEAYEAAETLPTFRDSVVRVERVKGVAVFVGETDSVVLDLEPRNVG